MNAELARRNMIQNQIRPWEALDPEVLGSLSIVQPEHVVSAAYRNLAFADFEIPVPCRQHTLAHKIEACILQAAAPPLSRAYTLEIGAGSGYGGFTRAAPLAALAVLAAKARLASVAVRNS